MVIGVFTDTFFPEINGVATSVILLKRELEKIGHTVYVFTSSNPALKKRPDIMGTFRMPSAPFIFLPSRRFAVVYKRSIARKVRSLNLDIVHTNTEFSLGMFGKLMAAALGVPVVHTYHTLYEDYVHYITKGMIPTASLEVAKLFTRKYCNSCQSVIVPTDKVKDLLLDYNVIRTIDVIPTGIDIGPFRRSESDDEDVRRLKERYGICETDKVILYVGRIAKEKNILAVMKQLPKYMLNNPKTKFVLVGDGPLKKEIKEIAASAGVSNNVVFTGEQPWNQIDKFYKMGDVFISASLSETQGLTFIEAMACGLSVIAKRDRSVEKLLIDGETGFFFDDDNEIPELLKRVFDNEDVRRKISANAVKTAEQNSSVQFAKSVERVYQRTLDNWKLNEDSENLRKKILNKIIM
ncbi:MAG: glycosyltransferase family 4 protein [Oscillospiraceae bacterium]|nr:glycosyltransferase family 4 protein [Oscillospiraceae bacterium]